MTAPGPLEQVKSEFGEKAKLVAAVEEFTGDDLWIARTNKKKGLAHVSNAKLLRLHTIFTEVKARFGHRTKLIDAICELLKRSKDEGFRARLAKYPVPRLYDLYKSTAKRQGVRLEKPALPKRAPRPAAEAAEEAAAPSKADVKGAAKPKAVPEARASKRALTKPAAAKSAKAAKPAPASRRAPASKKGAPKKKA